MYVRQQGSRLNVNKSNTGKHPFASLSGYNKYSLLALFENKVKINKLRVKSTLQ